MSDNSHIEWTDASWNPIRARRKDGQPTKGDGGWVCQRVSPGCEHCYAATINKRLGTGFDYDAKGVAASDIYLDEKALTLPLRWRKPRKVFVCSMTDLFAEWVPFEWIDRVFAVMALAPQHTFQVLTKRPERMREYLSGEVEMRLPVPNSPTLMRPRSQRIWLEAQGVANNNRSKVDFPWSADWAWPLPNCWLGTSVENQHWADIRIPELLATPAAVRFVSYEPALGPVDLRDYMHDSTCFFGMGTCTCSEPREVSLDWVIVGGESGPKARPFDVAWARSVVAQCKAAGVACFVKQLGSRPVSLMEQDDDFPRRSWAQNQSLALKSRKGRDMAEWPEDLRVREMPQ